MGWAVGGAGLVEKRVWWAVGGAFQSDPKDARGRKRGAQVQAGGGDG